jgi:hypothetical protein
MKVPYLTVSYIENDTRMLLTEYEQHFGQTTALPVDVEGIIESLFQLDLRFDDLKSTLGQDVLGATWIAEKKVRVDETLDPTIDERKEGRYRFTLGHEVGHWRLHRHLFEAIANQGNLFGTVSDPAIVCRSSSKEPQEWQADMYSGLLLMPEPLVQKQWEKASGSAEPYIAADEIEAIQTRWSLAENNTPTVSIARDLAKVFKVSGQAMQIRLIGLGLIRTQNTQPQLFMPEV